MRKNYVVVALLALVAGVALAAGVTTFTNLRVTNTLRVDGVSTLAGATNVTGLLSTSASTPYALRFSSAAVDITSTPASAGIVGLSSAYLMYVSTMSTAPPVWVKVGAQ